MCRIAVAEPRMPVDSDTRGANKNNLKPGFPERVSVNCPSSAPTTQS